MSEVDDDPMEKPGDEWHRQADEWTIEANNRKEEEMSEKRFSTDELVKLIKGSCGQTRWVPLTTKEMNAIIARLRAADKLCEELKESDLAVCELCKIVNPQHSNCTSCKERDDRVKAIADYEGKEEA
jgi:hypothetical protein